MLRLEKQLAVSDIQILAELKFLVIVYSDSCIILSCIIRITSMHAGGHICS